MGRPVTSEAEVARRRDDALPEMMVPKPVHEHAAGERVGRMGDPLCQQAAALPLGRVVCVIQQAAFEAYFPDGF